VIRCDVWCCKKSQRSAIISHKNIVLSNEINAHINLSQLHMPKAMNGYGIREHIVITNYMYVSLLKICPFCQINLSRVSTPAFSAPPTDTLGYILTDCSSNESRLML